MKTDSQNRAGINRPHPVILIIDDDHNSLDIMSGYLEECDYTILIAESGESGLKRADYARPDLILLDIMMPGLDGYETCRKLKELEGTRDTPVIFMTALADMEHKVRGFEAGAVDYVTKPFQREEVMARVGVHLRLRELTAGLQKTNEERLGHIKFLESLDRVNRVIQGAIDLNQMMNDTLETALQIFDCDRSWLFYPCDPYAESFRVPMEITRPEYPGAGILNADVPMPPDMALNLRETLESEGPVTFGLCTDRPVNKVSAEQFGVQSMMMVALYPKSGKPWAFGMHQCSYTRVWTSEEQRLFLEISRRLADTLTGLLSHRDLQESEDKLRKLNEELEQRVRDRTKELERRNHELEEMNKAFVGRELRMVELKARIKELENSGGGDAKAQ